MQTNLRAILAPFFLILLIGMLVLAGCGGSNPAGPQTSGNASTNNTPQAQTATTDGSGRVNFTTTKGEVVTFELTDNNTLQPLSNVPVTMSIDQNGNIFAIAEDSSGIYKPVMYSGQLAAVPQALNSGVSQFNVPVGIVKIGLKAKSVLSAFSFYNAVVEVDNQMKMANQSPSGCVCMTAREAGELIYKEQAGTLFGKSALLLLSGLVTGGGSSTMTAVIGTELAKAPLTEFVPWFLKQQYNLNGIIAETDIVAIKFKAIDPIQFTLSGLFLTQLYEIYPGTPELCGNIGNIAPGVKASSAEKVTQNDSVQLSGYVNPNGLDTSVYFRWGTSENNYPYRSPSQPIGNGTSTLPVNTIITGISPNKVYYFQIVAHNTKGLSTDSQWFFFNSLNSNPPVITTNVVPTGTAGNVYPATFLTAIDGNPPYRWRSLTALPPGLGLTVNGELSGIPTLAGNYDVQIELTDSTLPNNIAKKNLLFTIAQNQATLAAPTLTAVTPKCDVAAPGLALQWSAVNGATNYNIYRNGTLIYTTQTTGTSFWNVTGLTSGQNYTYQVQAVNSTSSSALSNSMSSVAPACGSTALSTPTLTAATPKCDMTTPGIELQWTAVNGATNYKIYRNGTLIFTTQTAGIIFWNVTGLTSGQNYTYQVQAINGTSSSSLSNSLAAAAPSCSTATIPGSFAVSGNAYCNTTPPTAPAVMLTWGTSAGATSYDVYRNNALYAAGVTGTSFDNNANVAAGQTYTYYIVARNSAGSAQSNTSTVTVPANVCSGNQTERITNGSFSSGPNGWVLGTDFWAGTDATAYRTAPGYAVGGVDSMGYAKNSAFGYMYQTVAIPANATSATLSFWYNITSQETGSVANDVLNVTVKNAAGSSTLATVAVLSNLNKGAQGAYNQISFDTTPYKGQTIQLHFLATTNSTNTTVFRIDDVSLMSDGN